MGVKNPHGIMVREGKNTLPFSRGILAGSIAEVGFDILGAYVISDRVLQHLCGQDRAEVDSSHIRELVSREIEKIDPGASRRYLFSREQKRGGSRKQIIILISGASGVGTSTIAHDIASRLNIKNIVSTDTVREIMRMMISHRLSPELHQSTFDASEESSIPIPEGYDPVVFGFERQSSLVSVGIEAVANRAREEGHDLIVEGVHVVPGFLPEEMICRDRTYPFLLTVPDTDTHRTRFVLRSLKSDLKRPANHYLRYFEEIRKIQQYLKTGAARYGFRIIENEDTDNTVELMLESIFTSEQPAEEH
jgi:2-phosphoglycerate kinase